MKKKLIIATVLVLIGIFFIIFGLLKKDEENISNLEFTNLQVTSSNSFTVDVLNISNKNIQNEKVNLYLLDNDKNVIMVVTLEIESLNSNEKKTIEYSQESIFATTPVDFYVKKYTDENEEIENISLESELSAFLEDLVREVVEENFANESTLDMTITAEDLENNYNKNIDKLKEAEYDCSLTDTFVEVKFINGSYTYTTYLNCNLFIDKN